MWLAPAKDGLYTYTQIIELPFAGKRFAVQVILWSSL